MQSQLDYLSGSAGPILSGQEGLSSKNQVIIGHSQGGLRALGWAGRNYQITQDPTKVKAVITIGSPVMGLATLSQGSGVLTAKVNSIAKKFVRAAGAILAVAGYKDGINQSVINQMLASFFPDAQITPSTQNPFAGVFRGAASLPDMTPLSDFISTNVTKQVVAPAAGYWVEVLTGYQTIQTGQNSWTTIPVYQKFWVEPVAAQYASRLPQNLVVGQISGGKRNIKSAVSEYLTVHDFGFTNGKKHFFPDPVHGGFLPDMSSGLQMLTGMPSWEDAYNKQWLEEQISKVLNTSADVADDAAMVYATQANYWGALAVRDWPLGFLDGYATFHRDQANQQAAQSDQINLNNVAGMMRGLQNTWDGILGNSDSDALIGAKDAQVDLKNLDGTVGPLLFGGTFVAANATHISETWDSEIWGGSIGKFVSFPEIKTGATLDIWLSKLEISTRVGTLVK